MTVLENLWYGNLSPISQDDYRAQDYCELNQLYECSESQLLSTLNECQKDQVQQMQALTNEMRSITECGAFITGFKLAIRLMAAAMDP